MSHVSLIPFAIVLLEACTPGGRSSAHLQGTVLSISPSDTAVFVLRAGSDTAAVDRVIWSGNRVSGTAVVGRTMTVEYRLVLGSTGDILTYAFLLGPSPTTIGDSITFSPPTVGMPTTVVSRGRIPLWNATPGLYDIVFRTAWSAAGGKDRPTHGTTTVALPLFRFGAASVRDSAFVTFMGRDSAQLIVRAEGAPQTDIFAHVDETGHLFRAAVPSEGWVIERSQAVSAEAYVLAPAYGASRGARYEAEDVRIAVGEGVVIAGTLTMPGGVRGPVPAVVLLHGSSPSDRNNSRPPLPGLFWQLADTFARRGIAVLRYDQRGVGASSGSADSATVQTRAADAMAALVYLSAKPGIDPTRLGLLGLSEGAMAAPLAALSGGSIPGGPSVRALVLISSPARTGHALSAYQTRIGIERFVRLTGRARDSALTLARLEEDSVLKSGRGHEAALLAYDPLPAARRLRIPVLIIHGATDMQVPVEDAEHLGAAIRDAGNRDVTVCVLPGVNHVLLSDLSGDWRHYIALPSLIAPAIVRGLIADWLADKLGADNSRRDGRSCLPSNTTNALPR